MSASATVPEGYKQTEIGVFPKDWEIKKFGDIFDFKSTASNSRSDLTETDEAHYIHYGDIHTIFHRHLDISKKSTPRIDLSLCKNATRIRNGDWVMADASEDFSGICKAIEISGIDEDKSVVAGLHTFLLRDRNEEYSPGFKGHLGEAKFLHDQYVRVSVGLKVFGVTKTSLRDLLIPVPPKTQQTKIEEILTEADAQIQSFEHLIAKKREIKQGTMQELLTGKTRLHGYNAEWVESPLKQICNIIRGNQISRSEVIAGLIPVIAGGKEPSCYHNQFNRSGITITISGSGANAGYVAIHDNPIFASDCSTISESISYDIWFVYYLMKSMQNKIYDLQTGGAQPHVYPIHLEPLIVNLPFDIEEQKGIGKVLSDMDAEIAALEKRLEKAKAIKQGMMQQLLTGKIRLVD